MQLLMITLCAPDIGLRREGSWALQDIQRRLSLSLSIYLSLFFSLSLSLWKETRQCLDNYMSMVCDQGLKTEQILLRLFWEPPLTHPWQHSLCLLPSPSLCHTAISRRAFIFATVLYSWHHISKLIVFTVIAPFVRIRIVVITSSMVMMLELVIRQTVNTRGTHGKERDTSAVFVAPYVMEERRWIQCRGRR